MKLRTELPSPSSEWSLTHNDQVFTIGSCFADVIGNKLRENKFDVLTNPFGNLFNPLSCLSALRKSISNKTATTLTENQGVWYSYSTHSDISAPSRHQLEEKLNKTFNQAGTVLRSSSFLVITFGTSVVYKLKETGEVAGNCHKMPQKLFTREMLSPEEIADAFEDTISQIRKENPGLKVILSVSPVRHVKDTLELNSVSKSILRYACWNITRSVKDVFYFPAYEILMDDLRDYRFYKQDLIHPSEMAEEYVWQKFSDCFFSRDTASLLHQWQKIRKDLSHKPFHPESENYRRFLERTFRKLEELKNKLNVEEEIQEIREKLS